MKKSVMTILTGAMVVATGCSVRLTNESPSYVERAGDDRYLVQLRVERDPYVYLVEPSVVVGGSPQPMTNADGDIWTYEHQLGGALRFEYFYDVPFRYWVLLPFPVITNQGRAILPEKGIFSTDVVGPHLDVDGDGFTDIGDNCPLHYNTDQNDMDGDGIGGACDRDTPGASLIGLTQVGPGDQFETVARDNTGNLILQSGGVNFYAFRQVESSLAKGTAVQGLSSLASLAQPDELTVGFGGMVMLYQSNTGGTGEFVQIFGPAGDQAYFEMRVGNEVIANGSDMLLTILTQRSGPNAGQARGYASVRLTGPDDSAFVQEVIGFSPAGRLALMIENFVGIQVAGAPSASTVGIFEAAGYLMVADLR